MKPLRTNFFSYFNALNLHLLGVALLLALNLALMARLFLAWHTLHHADPPELERAQTAYHTLDLENRPLRGLPGKVDQARTEADRFYAARFPAAYSTISSAINDLASKNSVHVTRVAYTQTPSIPGLAEVRIDAGVSGEYAPLMHFINGLERSKNFFLITGLTLTGQQGGLVNVRLRLTTYLHAADLNRLAPPNAGGAAAATAEEAAR